jgi:hypothetical protein
MIETSSSAQFWPAFIASVREQNAFVQNLVLRKYQLDLLDRGQFSVVSPFSGERVFTASCGSGLAGQIAYYFPDHSDFWLLTPPSRFKLGHPLAQMISDQSHCRHFLFNRTRTPEPIPVHGMQLLRSSSARASRSRSGAACLIIGHENFAHHLWNELPALGLWLERASDEAIARLCVFPVAEPLGSLRKIFPRLAAASFITRRSAVVEHPLRLRVGAQLVTSYIQNVIVNHCRNIGNHGSVVEILRTLKSGWPKVWISVRQHSRTPDNQLDFLLALLERASATYPNAIFVFDGFSFPVGFTSDPGMTLRMNSFLIRSQECAEFIQALCEKAARLLGPGIVRRLCSISGLDLAQAILVAGYCDYYICHGGTLQHKIGWLYRKPGFIHTAPEGSRHFLIQAAQVENAIIPDLLPPELARATRLPQGVQGVQDIPRNANYQILDVRQAVEAILSSMRAHMPSPDCHGHSAPRDSETSLIDNNGLSCSRMLL